MKSAKFWVSQLIMAVFLVSVLGAPALAAKGGGNKWCDNKVRGQCMDDGGSTGGDSGGSTGGDSGGSTDGGYSTGDQIGTTDGNCPSGYVWLDLYNMCIPIS